jgi:hypothetical protein
MKKTKLASIAALLFGAVLLSFYAPAAPAPSAGTTQTIELAWNQWLDKAHDWYDTSNNTGALDAPSGGYKKLFRLDPPKQDPVSITFKLTSANVKRFLWQNLSDEVVVEPFAVIQAKHYLEYANGYGSRSTMAICSYTGGTYYGGSDGGLNPFSGTYFTIDPTYCHSDVGSFTCPSTAPLPPCQDTGCVVSNNSAQGTYILYWAHMSPALRDYVRNGLWMRYAPEVLFQAHSTVDFDTHHGWWNWSDVRSYVSLKVTYND